ncbi:MAG: signal peptide peptidase SppA [Parahaliea sp.]
MSKPSILRRFFSGLWRTITWLRVALANILFLFFLVVVYLLFRDSGPELLPPQAALLLNPIGYVVDQRTPVDPYTAFFSEPNPANHEVVLQDVIDAIDYATDDPAITVLVMELDNLMSVGISKTNEISKALERFRATGKPIIARGDYYSQDQYLLASQADTVLMHPFGGVALEGFSSYRNYYQQALEKLSVNMHVFKAGEHKSIAEPFIRNDMSSAEREITQRWLDSLWQHYSRDIESRRVLESGTVNDYVNRYAAILEAHQGDMGAAAFDVGLVDQLVLRGASNDYIAGAVGAYDDDGQYQAVPFEEYVLRKRPLQLAAVTAPRIAVVTAEGDIMPGEQPPGTIGGDTLARLIYETAGAEGIKAIVLRINSGGGSVFASEVIRQAITEVQSQGLPVVVSMGAVAASGGYYIAAGADLIYATPTTITGSIGVFAAFPTIDGLMNRMGVHTDGVGTTELAGSLRVDRPLNEQLASVLTQSVENTYSKFLTLVAEGRGMTVEEVDALAQGRVWSAADAKDKGLLDRLGSLEEAIAAAAELAGLEDYEVEHVHPVLSPQEQLLQQLAQQMKGSTRIPVGAHSATLQLLLTPLNSAATMLASLQDPAHLYMRCVSCGPNL